MYVDEVPFVAEKVFSVHHLGKSSRGFESAYGGEKSLVSKRQTFDEHFLRALPSLGQKWGRTLAYDPELRGTLSN